MNGLVILGLDFGMALTKCAVAVQPPGQAEMKRSVLRFRTEDRVEVFHVPSAVWSNRDAISLHELDLPGVTSFHDGLKSQLLEAWAGSQSDPRSCAHAEELAFFLLAQVIANARRTVEAHLDREYPGARWTWMVNAATPAASASQEQVGDRERCMRALVAKAVAYAEANPAMTGAFPAGRLRSAMAEAESAVVAKGVEKRVTILRESLAAALFALQADDAERGTWLTIDVGALTTDTSLFFFAPEEEFRVAAYYAMVSEIGGMHEVARSYSTANRIPVHAAHESLRNLDSRALSGNAEYRNLEGTVGESIKRTLQSTCQSQGMQSAMWHLFEDHAGGRRCKFRLLLVGGGSSMPAMRERLANWRWLAFPHDPPDAVVARVPRDFMIMSSDGVIRRASVLPDNEHPILSIACGLAQQPWEMPSFDTIPAGRSGEEVRRAQRADEDWWGGN